MSLRKRVIKLAYEREDLRPLLLPILQKTANAFWMSQFKLLDKALPRWDATKVRDFNKVMNHYRAMGVRPRTAGTIAHYYSEYRAGRMALQDAVRGVDKEVPNASRMVQDPITAKTGREFHVAVRELPVSLQRALKSVGYKRKDIRVEPDATYSPSEGTAMASGQRGFVVVVNMATGQMKKETGSWGGGNMFENKQVDVDRKNYPIPNNGAVIVGSSGGRGNFAHIKVHPSNLAALLPGGEDEKLPADEQKALNIIGGIKGGARREYFDRARLGPYDFRANPILQSLAKKGLIKANRAGAMAITTKGRNARTRESFY